MAKTNAVYEEIFKEYTKLKSAEDNKTANARAKIEEAAKQIDTDKSLMEEATKRGDLEAYAGLKADSAKHTEIVKFFTGVLENAKRNPVITQEEATRLYMMASKEQATLKDEYNARMLEAIKPIIEFTNEIDLQIKLLEMAKNKIKNNLEHSPGMFTPDFVSNMHMHDKFDKLLQCDDYKRLSPDVSAEIKRDLYERYEWQAPIAADLTREAARW